MSEGNQDMGGSGSMLRNLGLAIAVLYVAASLWLAFSLRMRIAGLEAQQAESEKQLAATQSELKAATGALASQVGMTQKDLALRAAALQRQQREALSEIQETQEAQEQAKQQIGQVAGELSGVKGDVGGVRMEVASTRSDLEATKARLERTIGDMGVQSGLIARTRDDLDLLKRKGDRDYYEFTVRKNKERVPVANISLELKKTDQKKGKYTLNVLADDRTIEKKDRTLYEPIQFYSGRDRKMYEIVISAVEKDRISGYLATPKR